MIAIAAVLGMGGIGAAAYLTRVVVQAAAPAHQKSDTGPGGAELPERDPAEPGGAGQSASPSAGASGPVADPPCGPGPARIVAGPDGMLFRIDARGAVSWHRHLDPDRGGTGWASTGCRPIGRDWSGYRQIFHGGNGVVYGIDAAGALRWHRYLDPAGGSARWAEGTGRQVGSGWQHFSMVFAAGGGVIYGAKPDGVLCWYRHLGHLTGEMSWTPDGNCRQVGTGWTMFQQGFSPGDGAIYGIKPDGTLCWYKDAEYPTGGARWLPDGNCLRVGAGWQGFAGVSAAPNGAIYAVRSNGEVLYARHTDFRTGGPAWAHAGRTRVGTNWLG